jgi:hypothetical protein
MYVPFGVGVGDDDYVYQLILYYNERNKNVPH